LKDKKVSALKIKILFPEARWFKSKIKLSIEDKTTKNPIALEENRRCTCTDLYSCSIAEDGDDYTID
jgi:hypothetical protein